VFRKRCRICRRLREEIFHPSREGPVVDDADELVEAVLAGLNAMLLVTDSIRLPVAVLSSAYRQDVR
jgi:hypothetical protein